MSRAPLKKVFALLALCVIVVLFSSEAEAERKIGLLLFNDQPRYLAKIIE
jgi:hypothetical protein